MRLAATLLLLLLLSLLDAALSDWETVEFGALKPKTSPKRDFRALGRMIKRNVFRRMMKR